MERNFETPVIGAIGGFKRKKLPNSSRYAKNIVIVIGNGMRANANTALTVARVCQLKPKIQATFNLYFKHK